MASFFVRQNIIENEDKEVYEYGLQLLLSSILNSMIALLIAVISQTVIPCLIYLTVFIVMRKSAGGFHAKTHFGCCCILIAVISGFILFIKFVPVYIYFVISGISIFISMITILFFAPLEHENKPLKENDKIKLRKVSIVYMVIIFILIIIFEIFNLKVYMISTALGIFTSSVSILAAKIQKK